MTPPTIDSNTSSALVKRVAGAGAALFSVGMVTGLWSAVALTEQVKVVLPSLGATIAWAYGFRRQNA